MDWTVSGTQTLRDTVPSWGGASCSFTMKSLLRTVLADNILPSYAATADVTVMEVTRGFRLGTITIYRSTEERGLGQPGTGIRTTVCLVWNCFRYREITE